MISPQVLPSPNRFPYQASKMDPKKYAIDSPIISNASKRWHQSITKNILQSSTKDKISQKIFSIILQEPMVPNFPMGYNEGGLSFIYILRDANPKLLFHPTVEIITSSMVEITFTWINTWIKMTKSRWGWITS